MKKKVLITGISGMVGSHLADYLIEFTDWEIHGMCRWRSPLDNVDHLLPLVNEKTRLFFHMVTLEIIFLCKILLNRLSLIMFFI